MRKVLLAGLATAVCSAALVAQGTPVRPAAAPGPSSAPARAQTAPVAATRPAAPKPATSHPVTAPTGMTAAEQTALIGRYCATCHSERGKAGGLSLAGFDAGKPESHVDVAEKMIRKLRAGMMPPAGAQAAGRRRRSRSSRPRSRRKSTRWRRCNPNPGRRPFQRLNRAEYAAAVAGSARHRRRRRGLPAARHHQPGFDNVADVQTFSPTLMDGYLRAASQISRLAVGDRNASGDLGHLQDRPHRLADAPGRRRADRHPRRHLGGAHVPGRRRVHRSR